MSRPEGWEPTAKAPPSVGLIRVRFIKGGFFIEQPSFFVDRWDLIEAWQPYDNGPALKASRNPPPIPAELRVGIDSPEPKRPVRPVSLPPVDVPSGTTFSLFEKDIDMAMQIEKTEVTKLRIVGAEGLDPITVILEDLGSTTRKIENGTRDHVSRQGKLIIECYGESWSAYWGGMGDRTVARFVTNNCVDYLVGCLARGGEIDRQVFSGEALEQAARRCVIDCRRGRDTWKYECGHLDKEDARRLYDETEILSNFESFEGLYHNCDAGDLLTALFGEEWHHAVSEHAPVTHPKRLYLARITAAVQQALRQTETAEQGAAA